MFLLQKENSVSQSESFGFLFLIYFPFSAVIWKWHLWRQVNFVACHETCEMLPLPHQKKEQAFWRKGSSTIEWPPLWIRNEQVLYHLFLFYLLKNTTVLVIMLHSSSVCTLFFLLKASSSGFSHSLCLELFLESYTAPYFNYFLLGSGGCCFYKCGGFPEQSSPPLHPPVHKRCCMWLLQFEMWTCNFYIELELGKKYKDQAGSDQNSL